MKKLSDLSSVELSVYEDVILQGEILRIFMDKEEKRIANKLVKRGYLGKGISGAIGGTTIYYKSFNTIV